VTSIQGIRLADKAAPMHLCAYGTFSMGTYHMCQIGEETNVWVELEIADKTIVVPVCQQHLKEFLGEDYDS